MKKLILFLTIIVSMSAKSQDGFKWQTIDSTDKSKQQLYSLTKEFIATTWKSAKDVIQNDDNEGGVIIIKGLTNTYTYKFMMNFHDFIYQYSMKFYFKDKKYRVLIEDVKCYSAMCGVNRWDCVEPIERATEKIAYMPPEKVNEMMTELKKELNAIFLSYNNYIYNSKSTSDW